MSNIYELDAALAGTLPQREGLVTFPPLLSCSVEVSRRKIMLAVRLDVVPNNTVAVVLSDQIQHK